MDREIKLKVLDELDNIEDVADGIEYDDYIRILSILNNIRYMLKD